MNVFYATIAAHAMKKKGLSGRFPPSEPCSCEICRSYCIRPGWWTVKEASAAIEAGYAARMMLEMAPEMTFGVLSPAFKGCEGMLASNAFAGSGCTFLSEGLCELFGSGNQPLECRFCRHDRTGEGKKCHAAIEKDWNTPAGKSLIARWMELTGFRRKYDL